MSQKPIGDDRFLKHLSSRHHYIPRFLIEGFTNADGLLYIYDKTKDVIQKKPRPPKSIFYIQDRNTIDLDGTTKSSFIEDVLYNEIDNKASKVVKHYQNAPLSEITFGTEDSGYFLFFLIALFWRIPHTDYAADEILNRSLITGSSDPEKLKNDPSFKKMNRAGLFKHHIDEMHKSGGRNNKLVNIHQRADMYVIGDYPMLFERELNKFSEFDDVDYLVALSSSRIYSSTKRPINNGIPPINALRYNAGIINQSTRYIASGNLDLLKQSIAYYKEIKSTGLIPLLNQQIFNGL